MKSYDEKLLQALRENVDKITDCAAFLTLFSEKISEDWVPVMQMGIAVYLNKPIFVVCSEDQAEHIPENLRRIAKRIETYDGTLPEKEKLNSLHDATMRLLGDLP